MILQWLELSENALGKEHHQTLNSMSYLSATLIKQGKYWGSQKLYEETLKLQIRVLGEGHPDTCESIQGLGNVISQQGKYEEARRLHRAAFQATQGLPMPCKHSEVRGFTSGICREG